MDSVLLGVLSSPEQVAVYSVAVRLVKLPMLLMGAMVLVLIVHGTKQINEKKSDEFIKLMNHSMLILWMVLIPTCLVFFSGAPLWMKLMGGNAFKEGSGTLNIVSLILPCLAISNVAGLQMLLVHKKEKEFFKVVLFGFLLAIVGFFYMIPKYGAQGAALVTLCVELCVAIGMLYFAQVWFRKLSIHCFLVQWPLAMVPLWFMLDRTMQLSLPPVSKLFTMGFLTIIYCLILLYWVFKQNWVFQSFKSLIFHERN